jgi:hypothetical protein
MDVLRMLEVIYSAYESTELKNAIYQNVNSRESFQGIIIESYGRSVFCEKIITPFGTLHVSNGGTTDEIAAVQARIKTRIQYIKLLDVLDNKYHGCVGPFYLVTHIDDVPIENASVKGLTYDTYSTFVVPNLKGRDQYLTFIEDCIRKKMIRDKRGILDDIMEEPDTYPSFVKYLAQGLEYQIYAEMLCEDKLFHIFGLLLRKNMLVFNI